MMKKATLLTLFSSSFWALLAAVPLQQKQQVIGENDLVSYINHASDNVWPSTYELNPLIRASGQVSAVRIKRDASSAVTTQATLPKKNKKKKSFELECLKVHNKWRKLHGVPDLVFDKKIAAFSQKRADFIAASDGEEFKHPPDLVYGENLAWHSNEKKSCHDLIKMWYDEIDLYDYNKAKFSHEAGHFTQLVWKETQRVGCAGKVSDGPKGGIYLVCNYDPPGNFLGEFEQNVLRRGASSEVGPTTVSSLTTTTNRPTSTTTVIAVTPPNVKPITTIRPAATTAVSSTSTTIAATTTTPTTTSTKRPEKRKNRKNKRKNKKKKRTDKDKSDKDKDKNKKKKKKSNKKKNKKKATSSTTTTTTTTTTERSI